jgi:hypothetical protein
MRVRAALQGDLVQVMRTELRGCERAVTAGVRTATNGLKAELRAQVTGAGMSRRMANTWRSQVYPEGGQSIEAAGFVWSKAPHIATLYEHGGIIRSSRGLYLAIPTAAAGKFGDARQKITPGAWERIHGQRLRFVYRRGGRSSLLVADDARLTSRGRAVTRRAGSRAARVTVPIFILVPQVTVKKRFDVAGAHRKWAAALPDLVAQELERHDERS